MSFFQRLCSAPFPPVSCSFPEPHPDPQGCLYNLLERQPENSWPWEGKFAKYLTGAHGFIGLIFGTEKRKDRRTPTSLGNSYWGSADSAFGTC